MKNVVAISVEKVQKYIYKYIDQNQDDSKTLENIILASNSISTDILDKIINEFNIVGSNALLWISGKVIFKSNFLKEEINRKLIKLYKEVYTEYSGGIFLNYSVFETNNLSAIDIIKKANKQLKNNFNKVKIIQENKELLFNFQEFKNKQYVKPNLSEKECFSKAFLNNMDDLIDIELKESDSTNDKIAIVKADINDLGNIMQRIDDYNKFKKISELLKKYISLECFASYIGNYKDTKPYIFPFYVAGDDIFYAVKISYLFDSIKILKNIINKLNDEIKKIFYKENNLHSKRKNDDISIAVGITFVNNHQPIRYYRQLVEKELNAAKIMMKSDYEKLSLIGLSIAGCKLNCYKKIDKSDKKSNGKSDGFNRFCLEVDEIGNMLKTGVLSISTLYNLLIRLENNENPDQQLLDILYFCKPNLLKNENLNSEFYFKLYILSQIIEDSKGREERFFEKEKIIKILIPKLKVILLVLRRKLSSGCINSVEENKKYIVSKNMNPSILLNKPINSILREIKTNSIESLFIRKKEKYQTTKFNPSLFFRAKKLMESNKKDQVITLFENYYESFINTRDENIKNNNPHTLEFDIIEFKKRFKETDGVEWLDRLIILYEYNKQRVIYKIYSSNYKCNRKK